MPMRSTAPLFLTFLLSACSGGKTGEATPNAAPKQPPPVIRPEAGDETSTQTKAPSSQTPSALEADGQQSSEPKAVRDPNRASALLEAGRMIQQEKGEGGAAEAIIKYTQAIEADPHCAACYWELGWSKQLLSDWSGNLEAWDRVRQLDPDFPELKKFYLLAEQRKRQADALAALPDVNQLPEVETQPWAGPTITVNAVGDVQMGRAWPEHRAVLPPKDALDLFAAVEKDLNGAQVVFGNLETALRDEGDSNKCGPKSTKCFAFRVPTKYAKALKQAGFTAMSIANNHAGDFGEEGRKSTMEALDGSGILHSGPIGDLASWEIDGVRLAMVAFSTGGGVYSVLDIDTAKKLVADLARRHDILIVSFHGGAEGTAAAHVPEGTEHCFGENRGDLRTFTHAVIDAGADLVLGHGPHLLRGMELYKGRLIAYSLGNYSSWRTFSLRGPLGITGILKTKLASNGVLLEAQLLPQYIQDPGRPRPDPERRAIDIVRKLSEEEFGNAFLDEEGRWQRPKQNGPVG